eukprot:TRINITY_DN12175_c0_g1_i1.p1 TRINITY_DN12175_c0_g1~~TRINITY_DN12175_c0_g1_i1.p1  ORF type:complete len:855 (+),score=323.88 TRINITY_DN12175_c0_g1_i1:109-2673(+)
MSARLSLLAAATSLGSHFAASSSADVTPLEKVVTLLTDLKAQVEEEGKAEATAYDTFACFCKDSTATKSEAITTGQDSIDQLSADIQADTASQAEKETELEDRKKSHEELSAKLEAETVRCQKESAEFEAKILDLEKAISSLDKALTAMKDSKPASLLSIRESVGQSLALADVLGMLKAGKRKVVQAFLQKTGVDPEDPEYKFHSQGIIDTLEKLQTEFNDEKTSVQDEWSKHTTACDELKKGLEDEISANEEAMETLKGDIENLKTKIAENRAELVNTESQLTDDQTFLKDLTIRCEKRAKVWDQRTEFRGKEIEALTQALEILEGKVTETESVNKRAMLLVMHKNTTNASKVLNSSNATAMTHLSRKEAMQEQSEALKKLMSHLKEEITGFNKFEDKSKSDNTNMVAKVQARVDKDHADLKKANLSSFERELITNRTKTDEHELSYWKRGRAIQHTMFHANLKMTHGLMSKVKDVMAAYDEMLTKGKLSSKVADGLKRAGAAIDKNKKANADLKRPVLVQQESKRLRITNHARRLQKEDQAKEVLNNEADRLKSPALSALAEKIGSDPFGKVKKLIQDLVERLLKEATEEATKKGFCDTELGKARQDRDARFSDTEKLTADIAQLEAKQAELEQAIIDLGETVETTTKELEEATTAREEEKTANLDTIKKAREGAEAVTEAIGILKTFYKSAAKAKVFLQASPVDEEDPGAKDTAYTGQQGASTGVIGLLEVLKTDFEHTVKTTTDEEKKAAEDHVEFDRESKSNIAAADRGKEISEQELEMTKNALTQTMTDIESAQNLVDAALKTIEDLKPMCIDNVMSYEDRVKKREEEIAALKKAVCLLDPEGVETDC